MPSSCYPDLDAMFERADADRLPAILQARILVRLDGIGARLARMREAVRDGLNESATVSPARDAPGDR
jgi:hypothetical protein